MNYFPNRKRIKYISMRKLAVYTDNKSRHDLRFDK